MSEPDHLDLDGRLLALLLAVAEEGSITRAAQRLGVTQSAVSHGLDRLRAIVGDPLFVKAGRGIAATRRAEAMAAQARVLLDGLRGLASAGSFEPARLETTLTIAANELQRDLLLPPLLRRLRAQAPGLRLRVVPSGVPDTELLRDERCQLVVTPRPPDGTDIVQLRLFADRYRVFFDCTQRGAPGALGDYLAAEHVTVRYADGRRLDIDEMLAQQGVQRRIVASVPGFSGVPPFLRGSRLLATLPGLLGRELLRGFAQADVPVPCPEMPMYMVWHRRHADDAMHRWVRDALVAVAREVVDGANPPA